MDSDKRGSKKYKVDDDDDVVCREIYSVHVEKPCFYHVVLKGNVYLLDYKWQIIRLLPDSFDVDSPFFRALYAYDNYPAFEDICEAKRRLDPLLFAALFKTYVNNVVDYVEFNTVPPQGFEYADGTIGNLAMHYEKCETQRNREACIRVLFAYMYKKRHTRFTVNGLAPYYNELVQILVWKDVAQSNLFYAGLQGREKRLLQMLACARNRKRGDNFFAQMPKDILFGVIFPLLKWSLPFLLPHPPKDSLVSPF
jgi:hypothetical protein